MEYITDNEELSFNDWVVDADFDAVDDFSELPHLPETLPDENPSFAYN